jgi:biopolymer transport protein ExbB
MNKLHTALCAWILSTPWAFSIIQAAEAAGESAAEHPHTLWDKIKEGGWVMFPIAFCSVAMIWLCVDVIIKTSKKKMVPPQHVATLQDLFRAGDYVAAYNHCKNYPTAFTDTVRAALSFVGEGQEALESSMFSELNRINANMQTRINYLSVIGVCTPMIGLTGTVTGMMTAFSVLNSKGAGDTSALSGAIGEVLVATASGLFIAVPAFFFFYVLKNKLQGTMHYLQEVASSLLRKMPYAQLKDAHVGDEEFFAATPNWIANAEVTNAEFPA